MLMRNLPVALVAAYVLVGCPLALAQSSSLLKGQGVNEAALLDALAPPPLTRSIDRSAGPSQPAKAALLITFQTGSASLTPDARRDLDIVGKALNTSKLEEYTFVIEGHSDPRGSASANMRLSQGRAEAVRRYLVQQQHVREDRLQAIGKGDLEPLNPGDPAAPENRRITFVNTFKAGN